MYNDYEVEGSMRTQNDKIAFGLFESVKQSSTLSSLRKVTHFGS